MAFVARLRTHSDLIKFAVDRLRPFNSLYRYSLKPWKLSFQSFAHSLFRFIGICVQKQPIMIVMELVPGGSLLNFLRTSADKLNTKALLGRGDNSGVSKNWNNRTTKQKTIWPESWVSWNKSFKWSIKNHLIINPEKNRLRKILTNLCNKMQRMCRRMCQKWEEKN